MRLWSIHPQYLDAKGLTALWREALLAQKVLQEKTKGYRNHPQLTRFKSQQDPVASIAHYLEIVHAESARRGYRFDESKIAAPRDSRPINVTRGQALYEWEHLKRKLIVRDPVKLRELELIRDPEPHPLFKIIEGEIETWEKIL